MTTTINADNGVSSGSAGLKSSADSSGILALQTNGTTALSIDASQNVSFTNQPTYSGGTANGVAYLNGSKVLTTGSALVFDGTNLGVGVTPSAWGTGSSMDVGTQTSVHYSGSVGALFGKNVYYNAGYKYKATGTARAYVQDDGGHSWSIAASGTAGNAITFTQAMTLDASGRLGVGTSSPSAKLTVVGGNSNTIIADNDGSQYTQLLLQRNSTANTGGDLLIDGTNATMSLRMLAVGALRFCTSTSVGDGTERARIDSSGNLLVAGTSTSGINSGGGFYVNANSLNTYTMTSHVTGSASGSPYAYFYYANSYLGQISQSGTTGVNYTSASDYRLKNITGPLTGAKEFIMALQPKQGTWKSDGSRFVGFLAHEFQEVSPSSVSGEKDAVDEDGNPIMQSMQASSPEVMANLVAFIQEQQAIITQLQADVAALKGA